jgi:hypothetical protein
MLRGHMLQIVNLTAVFDMMGPHFLMSFALAPNQGKIITCFPSYELNCESFAPGDARCAANRLVPAAICFTD